MAETIHLEFYRGEHVTLNFTDRSGEDIAGRTYQLTIRKKIGDTGTPVLQKIGVIQNAALSKYSFDLTHAETVLIAPSGYVVDVQRIDIGSEAVGAIGTCEVKGEVLYP